MKNSMQSISFSREENIEDLFMIKGTAENSMQSISFSREEFIRDLFMIKGTVK